MDSSNENSKFIPKRGAIKKFLKKGLFFSMIGGAIYTSLAVVHATNIIYKVKTNYAVALEEVGGERVIVNHDSKKSFNWHIRAPFFTTYEKEISLMQREMYLDGDITPHTIVSSDGISLLVSGLLTYQVKDAKKWAINIENAQSLLQRDFNGMAKDIIQSNTENNILHQREKVKNLIFQKLKTIPINEEKSLTLEQKYGIELVSFNITDAEYPPNIQIASQRKKELELLADGEKNFTETTYGAYTTALKNFMEKTGLSRDQSVEYLIQQAWANAYQKSKGQKTYVINNTSKGNQGNLGLNLPANDSDNDSDSNPYFNAQQRIQNLENKLDSFANKYLPRREQ